MNSPTFTFPSLRVHGDFNLFGHDQGLPTHMIREKHSGSWILPIMAWFPTNVTLDVWGDGIVTYGDVDGDGILDRLPPTAQGKRLFLCKVLVLILCILCR
jgi:alpha-1,3-glucan synthase